MHYLDGNSAIGAILAVDLVAYDLLAAAFKYCLYFLKLYHINKLRV